MAKKYYGVRNGNQVGVFDNWADCQKQINGFSGAEYKSFPTKEQAQEFVYGVCSVVNIENTKDMDTSDFIEVYVDGSFKEDLNSIGYGIVFVKDDMPIFKDCGRVATSDTTERNVTGEIYATIRTIQMCIANGYKDIILCYDYKGLECWANGSWKANKPLTKRYVEYYNKYTKEMGLNIIFKHTPAHTGIKWNEEADKLAKLGCTL